MPSLTNPDDFPYRGQDEDLPECVVACVAMVYEFLELDYRHEDLAKLLEFDPYCGTPFENIANLPELRITAVHDLQEVELQLSGRDATPIIANLLIGNDEVLGYLLDPSFALHAVVILAIDTDEVTFSDPLSHAMLSTEAHRTCSRFLMEQAWLSGYALRRKATDSQ